MRYTVDTEFDGHNGPLISLALVPEYGTGYYARTKHDPKDPWVRENVMPISGPDKLPLLDIRWDQDDENWLGHYVRDYLMHVMKDMNPVFIADSPVDIARIANILSTNPRGDWQNTVFESIRFEVHNVDCWPNDLGPEALQHNAYWDAVALWEKLK